MDEYDVDEMMNSQKEVRRRVRLVRNGDPSQLKSCLIKDHINFEGLSEVVCDAMEVSRRDTSSVRVFKTGGVEVFKEDVQYIKDGDILFVSFGDEFDESSNFAVYKLMRCLGQGGYGKVYEAKNRLNKDRFAIKMIDCSKIKNAKDTEMIYKELIALKNLNHKGILKVFNCFTLQKEMKVALILEYLEGGDLRDYLNVKKVLDEKEAQKLFKQLFFAMQYCHKESIIHRDLKLENIMFEDKEHERLKVVDFGISGRQSLINIEYTEAGSIRYLAPEVITSHAPAHPSIDVWAMGCILFWMLTGNSPFPQNTREAVQDSIVKGKWAFSQDDRKKLTKASQQLIKDILVVDPKSRATMGEIAEHEWMQLSVEEILEEEEREREKASSQKEKKASMTSSNSSNYSIEINAGSSSSTTKKSPFISSSGNSANNGNHLGKVQSPALSHQPKISVTNVGASLRKPQIPSFDSNNGNNGITASHKNLIKPLFENRLVPPKGTEPHRRFSEQIQVPLFGFSNQGGHESVTNKDTQAPKKSNTLKAPAATNVSRSKSPADLAYNHNSKPSALLSVPQQKSGHSRTHSGDFLTPHQDKAKGHSKQEI